MRIYFLVKSKAGGIYKGEIFGGCDILKKSAHKHEDDDKCRIAQQII